MNDTTLSLILFVIAIMVWILPKAYPIIATVMLAIYAAFLGTISISSAIVILILAVAGYHLLQRHGQKDGIIRVIILLLIAWSLFSQDHDGKILSWTSYIEMIRSTHPISIKLTFEKVLVALLIASYLLSTKFSLEYWHKIINSGLSVLFLAYIALLLPLVIFLHLYGGLAIGQQNLTNLLLNLFLLCFTDEIIFRQVLQNWLHQIIQIKFGGVSKWLPILLVSLIYSLFHLEYGLIMVLFTLFVGTAYGYIYQKSGKIEAAILVHFALSLTFCLVITFLAGQRLLPIIID